MSHHADGSELNGPQSEIIRQIREAQAGLGLGSTRRFPNGVVNDIDQGEIKFAIGSDPERELVLLNFGTSIDFLGMKPQEAIEMAQLLIRHARAVAKSPVVVQLH